MMEIQRILMALAVIFCFCAAAAENNSSEFITDLDVVAGDENVKCKDGYTKLPQNLNEGTFEDSSFVFACIKRGGIFKTPLNDIVVIDQTGSLSASDCPENYEFVETNLNTGTATSARNEYFCYSRGHDTMITEIDFLPYDKEKDADFDRDYPNGTCDGHNLNDGVAGECIYMCFSFVENNITKIELSDVVYDFNQTLDSYVNIVSVEAIVIYNPSDIDTSPATFTGTHSYTATSNWAVSDSESQTRENSVNIGLSVTAGIPILGAKPGVEGGYGWKESETQTHETTLSLGVTVQASLSYTISCVAPKKTSTECGGEYKQGKISVPYNATRKTIYDNGEYEITNITNYMYQGISAAVLQVYQEVVEQL